MHDVHLTWLDWLIVAIFFVFSLAVGIIVARKAGRSTTAFFLSGRNMPWWLLGISMVATTFAADTPNLVTDIVRQHGVSGNWVWWAFLLTGMLTVFVYAKLWRRSDVMTDLEFYELRYSGKAAAFLRGFRSLYLGVFFNVMIMANVTLAAIKLGGVLLGLSPLQTILIASVITVIYSSLGGLRGILITDFFQFAIAMAGSIWAAYEVVHLPEIDGLSTLLLQSDIAGKLNILPDFDDSATLVAVFIIPIAVQWWSVWYPGSEPGGGGYVAQRMLSARNEKHAIAATLLFNVAHYALRPWPWIIIALASMVVFPTLESIEQAFPHLAQHIIGHDLAYPAMLTFLPSGLLGLMIASLIAAFMSTISTHLNWGASYVVHDFYKRFIDPGASEQKLVALGRISTVFLMLLSAILALYLQNAMQGFNILLSIGAGTGLIFILRWFWWRINAYTEITGMVVSFFVALYFEVIHVRLEMEPIDTHVRLLINVGITSAAWITVTFLTRPTQIEKLQLFYRKVKPAGRGWKKVRGSLPEASVTKSKDNLSMEILSFVIGSIAIYCALFGIGYLIYGSVLIATFLLTLAVLGFIFILNFLIRKKGV